jgi:hypothetical protein
MNDTTHIPHIPERRGPNVMLMAASGSGKTHSIRSLIAEGVECFVLATEPGIESVLGDLPKDKLHWHYLPPVPLTLDMLEQQARQINTMDFKGLAEMKVSRNEFRQMLDFVSLCKNFKCQRTGQEFGPVTSWGADRAFIVDSLSGLTLMAINSFVGTRPALNVSDYGVIQKLLESTVNSLAMTLKCWFVLTAHVEKETNEITGAVDIMASTIGRKLAPKLGRFFDEVIYLKRDGATFSWSNAERNVDVKKRMLPLSEKLEPSFKLLATEWRKRNP